VAARLARRHVERAAWANDGKGVPPSPKPACLLPSTAVRGGGPCRLGRCRQAEVAHAATLKTGTLGTGRQRIPNLNGADSHAALIPTLTGVFFRRERPNLCVHVICNLCCFYLSIRCFGTLFRTVNRLAALLLKDVASRMQQALLIHSALSRSVHSFTQLSLSLSHSFTQLSLSLIQSALSRTPSPTVSSLMS
jgi:hypothetical protein